MKIVSQCREQARRVYYGAVLEIKKEIPNYSVGRPAAVMEDAIEIQSKKKGRP